MYVLRQTQLMRTGESWSLEITALPRVWTFGTLHSLSSCCAHPFATTVSPMEHSETAFDWLGRYKAPGGGTLAQALLQLLSSLRQRCVASTLWWCKPSPAALARNVSVPHLHQLLVMIARTCSLQGCPQQWCRSRACGVVLPHGAEHCVGQEPARGRGAAAYCSD